MTAPEESPLPWHNDPNSPCMRDANNEIVEIYGTHGYELRDRIVTAVNSNANLLSAMKFALARFKEPASIEMIAAFELVALEDAIAAANSHTELLAAAKEMLSAIATRDIGSFTWESRASKALQAAIAAAEDQAP